MKQVLNYFLAFALLISISPQISAQTESSMFNNAKKTVNKHVKALLHCLRRKECTPEAYTTAIIAVAGLIPLVLGIGTTVGLVVKTRKPSLPPIKPGKEEEEVPLERKTKKEMPSEGTKFQSAQPEEKYKKLEKEEVLLGQDPLSQ